MAIAWLKSTSSIPSDSSSGGHDWGDGHYCDCERSVQAHQYRHYVISHIIDGQRVPLKPPFLSMNQKEPYPDDAR